MVNKFLNNTKNLKTVKFGNRQNIVVSIQLNIPTVTVFCCKILSNLLFNFNSLSRYEVYVLA